MQHNCRYTKATAHCLKSSPNIVKCSAKVQSKKQTSRHHLPPLETFKLVLSSIYTIYQTLQVGCFWFVPFLKL